MAEVEATLASVEDKNTHRSASYIHPGLTIPQGEACDPGCGR